MGQGIFLGEAYLPLQEISEENMDRPLRDLPQLQLPLTRPQDHGNLTGTLLMNILPSNDFFRIRPHLRFRLENL